MIMNKALVAATTDKGKTISRWDLVVNGTSVSNRAHELTTLYEDLPEDDAMQAVLAEFEAALRAKNYEPGEKLGEDEEGLTLISAEKGENDE
jgi:2',3'-cyclic-nucleotide 2'-phosphodiesterase (5'-nucleotidase family)